MSIGLTSNTNTNVVEVVVTDYRLITVVSVVDDMSRLATIGLSETTSMPYVSCRY